MKKRLLLRSSIWFQSNLVDFIKKNKRVSICFSPKSGGNMLQNCWVTNIMVMMISLVVMTLLMMTMTIMVAMTFHLSYVLIDDDDFVDDDDNDEDLQPEPCREPGPRPTLASRGNPVSSRCFFTSSKSPTNSPLISS